MKDKMNDNKIKQVLKDYVVSWPTLMLVTVILFVTDYSLSKPLYTIVLDMPDIGNGLAFGMAILFGILPKVAAKLMAKEWYGLSAFAFICGIGLLSFIYIGQEEVARQKAADPLNMFMTGTVETASESNAHIVATGLIALLYSCALLLGYLYYSDEQKFKPTGLGLSMSQLGRAFQYKLLLLKGRFQRAFFKPQITAEGKVNAYIETLENKLFELQRKLDKQEGERNYELALLENARARIKAAIHAAYKN